eukprot:1159375-Pelagomonas_calceolata.AAC.5
MYLGTAGAHPLFHWRPSTQERECTLIDRSEAAHNKQPHILQVRTHTPYRTCPCWKRICADQIPHGQVLLLTHLFDEAQNGGVSVPLGEGRHRAGHDADDLKLLGHDLRASQGQAGGGGGGGGVCV